MTLSIGRFTLEISMHDLYLRVPLLGSLHLSRELGLHADSWRVMKAVGEV